MGTIPRVIRTQPSGVKAYRRFLFGFSPVFASFSVLSFRPWIPHASLPLCTHISTIRTRRPHSHPARHHHRHRTRIAQHIRPTCIHTINALSLVSSSLPLRSFAEYMFLSPASPVVLLRLHLAPCSAARAGLQYICVMCVYHAQDGCIIIYCACRPPSIQEVARSRSCCWRVLLRRPCAARRHECLPRREMCAAACTIKTPCTRSCSRAPSCVHSLRNATSDVDIISRPRATIRNLTISCVHSPRSVPQR